MTPLLSAVTLIALCGVGVLAARYVPPFSQLFVLWLKNCSACRLEAQAGCAVLEPHTCSKSRAMWSSADGSTRMFLGRLIPPHEYPKGQVRRGS